jgi:uncharacterized membrane protein
MSATTTGNAGGPPGAFRAKYIALAIVGVMFLYVFFHNEQFLFNRAHPVWQHYEPFKWWLLPHGLAGLCTLVLGPLQFSNRLRLKYLRLHRTTGAVYVTGALVLAPIGIFIQYMDESQGAARSFTIETVIQSSLLMITTALGLFYALRGNIWRHRQWMVRSFAIAVTFLEIRVILGLFGLDHPPPDWHVIETVVWGCTATSLLVGDIANQIYERNSRLPARA